MHVRQSAEQAVDGDLPFEPGERRSEAKVCPESERQVPVWFACEIECVRVLKLCLVPVGRGDHGEDERTPRDHLALDDNVLARIALGGCVDRTVITQKLFDSRL